MNLRAMLVILRKDLAMGPRSPLLAWGLLLPLIWTLLLQGVFGSLFDTRPRLGVVDEGQSALTAALLRSSELDVRLVADGETLLQLVRGHDLDAGLLLAPGFDDALRAGELPLLPLYVSGESLASDRVLVSMTALDLVRTVEGRTSPVTVSLVGAGEGPEQRLLERMLPLVVLVALLVAGMFIPAFSLVEERERRTLDALLATPARLADVLVAKAVLGLVLGLVVGVVTLALNGVLVGQPPALLASLLIGGLMAAVMGLLFGTLAKDATTLFTLAKSINILLVAPVLFYIFPDWPQWIARIFPTYWFLEPIVAVTTRGAGLPEVGGELLVALAWCVALALVVAVVARRLQGPSAAG
jgi:ABC-2 type transport system permease protein